MEMDFMSNSFTSMRDAHFIAMIATVSGGSKMSYDEIQHFIDEREVDDPVVKRIASLIANRDADLTKESTEVREAVEKAREWARRNREVHALHPLPSRW